MNVIVNRQVRQGRQDKCGRDAAVTDQRMEKQFQ
jgi:hypothetical protein